MAGPAAPPGQVKYDGKRPERAAKASKADDIAHPDAIITW